MLDALTICVTGGRSYLNHRRVREVLDQAQALHSVTKVIHGACPTGADAYAHCWCVTNDVDSDPYPADWHDLTVVPCVVGQKNGRPYNKLAGFNRNIVMARKEPDYVLVFPGGPGTMDMMHRALKRDIPIDVQCEDPIP